MHQESKNSEIDIQGLTESSAELDPMQDSGAAGSLDDRIAELENQLEEACGYRGCADWNRQQQPRGIASPRGTSRIPPGRRTRWRRLGHVVLGNERHQQPVLSRQWHQHRNA